LRNEADLEKELNLAIEASLSQGEWLNRLRRLRCREILRIGARDILLKAATTDVMFELSVVAQEIIRAAVRQVFRRAKEERRVAAGLEEPERHFCILALGKLGGQELNYSSDVDIVAVRSDFGDSGTRKGVDPFALKDFLTWIMEKASLDLSAHTEEGYAYRVDLRLRPYGRAGDLVPSFSGLRSTTTARLPSGKSRPLSRCVRSRATSTWAGASSRASGPYFSGPGTGRK
jgi:glutamate-ammonia-ligase adenylyltransferase